MRLLVLGVVGCSVEDPPLVGELEPVACAVTSELAHGSDGPDVYDSDDPDDGVVVVQGGRGDYAEPEIIVASESNDVSITAELVVDDGTVMRSPMNYVALQGWESSTCAGWARIRLFPLDGFIVDCSLHLAPATLKVTIGQLATEEEAELAIDGPIVLDDYILEREGC